MKKVLFNLGLLLVLVLAGLFVNDLYQFSKLLRFPNAILHSTASDEPVELIVVLTGGQGRFRAGVELMKRFPKATLLVSGTESFVTLDDVLKANNLSDLDDSFRSRIWLGKFSKNTEENAIELRDVAEKISAKEILLVTSSYHVRRALELIRIEFLKSTTQARIYYYPVESPNFPEVGWWRKYIGWRIFFSEYFKSIRVLPARDDA